MAVARGAVRAAAWVAVKGVLFIVISCPVVVTRAASTGEILKTVARPVCGACVGLL
jgi:hypothetical protein